MLPLPPPTYFLLVHPQGDLGSGLWPAFLDSAALLSMLSTDYCGSGDLASGSAPPEKPPLPTSVLNDLVAQEAVSPVFTTQGATRPQEWAEFV